MSRLDTILWVLIPYIAITIFTVGHIWRWRRDQFTWTTRSTQLLEGRSLKWGSLLFHFGLLAVLGGHISGLLVPESVTRSVGVSEHLYHLISVTAGAISGSTMTIGFILLAARRVRSSRVRRVTTRTDIAVYIALGLMIVTGMYATVGVNLLGGGYDYRLTVGPYFRSIFTLHPHTALISGAPLIYQVHVLAAFGLYTLWPFSRLVHAWSVPLRYLARAPIIYRSRTRTTSRPHPAISATNGTPPSRSPNVAPSSSG
jgi:nitrate reductase gamma subunit